MKRQRTSLHQTQAKPQLKAQTVSQAVTMPSLFQRALSLHRQGQFDQAKQIYLTILKSKPDHVDALYLLGIVAFQSQQLIESLVWYDKAILINVDCLEAHLNRGVALHGLKRFVEAVSAYDRAITIKQDCAEAYFNKGNTLRELRRVQEAISCYEKAIALKPDYAKAQVNLANTLLDMQSYTATLKQCDSIIALNSNYAEAYLVRGNALIKLKRFEAALADFDWAIHLRPDYPEAYSNRGVALKELGRLDDAVVSYDRAIALRSDYVEAFSNRGHVLRLLKRFDEAVVSYTRAVMINLHYPEVLLNLGILLRELKRFDEALNYFDRLIHLSSEYDEAYLNHGITLQEMKRFGEAISFHEKAISLNPSNHKAYQNRGYALMQMKQFEASIDSFNQALRLNPEYHEAYSNRGVALFFLRRLDEALKSFDLAIGIKSDFSEAHSHRGIVLHELKLFDVALSSFDASITSNPDNAESYWNKSISLLLTSEFRWGWELYEWRWSSVALKESKRAFMQSIWLGECSLQGKTIFLHSEQGLGDTLQFCRYAEQMQAQGARVILEVQKPLVHVLKNLKGVDVLIGRGSDLPVFDYHCPLLSLPLAFKTDLKTIPASVPYLHAEPERVQRWRQHLGSSGFKIAICWQGNSQSSVDVGRSFPVALFACIAAIPGVRLISLQKNEGTEQLTALPTGMKVETLPDDFDEGDSAFLDSAAIMQCVDLVITSDTALTHLAGALGVKTFLPLKYVPDWRWLLDRQDSPWYPNHRLFRQQQIDDWSSVFASMAQAVVDMKESRS